MFNFLPKDHKFYDELESLSGHVVSASRELRHVVQDTLYVGFGAGESCMPGFRRSRALD